jgi:rhodanese-related sulfurtransferase
MKHVIRIALLLLPLIVIGCSKQNQTQTAANSQTGEVSVDELATMIEQQQVTVLDANNANTRQKYGVIPGSTLLSSYDSYEISELPAEKEANLVFYCANTQCSASHKGAARALEAGYVNVKVLPAGIAGWKDAGRETQAVQ